MSASIPVKVTLKTYDGETYVKAHPENETRQNNENDHDEFLEMLGNLLNIPRRQYKDFLTGERPEDVLRDTIPYINAKYDENDNIIPGSEDDYYYYQRLKYFIENYQTTFPPALMMKILYEWEFITVYDVHDRQTSITEIYNNNYYYLILSEDESAYINIDDTDKQEQVNKYDLITRPSYVAYITPVDFICEDDTYLYNISSNTAKLLAALYDTQNGLFINNAPIEITTPDGSFIKYLNENDIDDLTGVPQIKIPGLLPAENQTITAKYVGEFEYLESNPQNLQYTINEDYDIDLSNWEYKVYSGSSVSPSAPRVDDNGYISMGRGYLTYIPGLYLPLAEAATVTIIFHYGYNTAQLGLTRLKPGDNDKMSWDSVLTVKPYDILSLIDYSIAHELKYIYQDNIFSIYMDGNLIKEVEQLPEWELLYITGFNGTTDNNTSHRGLYIESATIKRGVE